MAPLVSLFLLLSPPLRCHDNILMFVEGKKPGKKNMMRHPKAPPKAQRKLDHGAYYTPSPTPYYYTNFPTPYYSYSPTPEPTIFVPPPANFTPCEDGEMTVSLDLLTDRYPDEISWNITNTETGDGIVGAEYKYYMRKKLFKYQYCFPLDSCLRFDIFDTFGDGIYGPPGGYNLTVDGVLLSTSYDDGTPFEPYYNESYYDDNFNESSYYDYTLGDFDYSEGVRFGDSCAPTTSPSESPTEAPTISQVPTPVPTVSPTLGPCDDGLMTFELAVLTDYYPSETSWTIIDTNTGLELAGVDQSGYTTTSYKLFNYRYCFPSDSCIKFEMRDSYGDGIYLPYGYNFTVDGVLLATSYDDIGGDIDYYESVEDIGDGCPSPTDVPSTTPSVEPTEDYCVDDPSFVFRTKFVGDKDCAWLSKKYTRKLKYCDVKPEGLKKKVKYYCREACEQFIDRCSFPTAAPTVSPAPTMTPTDSPTMLPSPSPSTSPSSSPSLTPSSVPTTSPTDSPTMFPSPSPSSTPSSNPTVECVDDNETTFEIKEGQDRDCQWLSEKAIRREKYCEVKGVLKDHLGYAKIKYTCRGTCKQFLKFCSL